MKDWKWPLEASCAIIKGTRARWQIARFHAECHLLLPETEEKIIVGSPAERKSDRIKLCKMNCTH